MIPCSGAYAMLLVRSCERDCGPQAPDGDVLIMGT